MDAIAITLATNNKYVGVAPLGTSLTQQQAAQLAQHPNQTPIIATDNDLAGQVAAQRDYWILTPYQHNPRYAALPPNTDPADLVANNQTHTLTQALNNATPLAHHLIDERFAHLPPYQAAQQALQIIAAQPPNQWENGLQHTAQQINSHPDVLRHALTQHVTAWNQNPQQAAQKQLATINQTKTRLAQHQPPTPTTPTAGPTTHTHEHHQPHVPGRPAPKPIRR